MLIAASRTEQMYHAAEMEKALFRGDFATAAEHVWIVLAYGIVTTIIAVFSFLGQMKRQ
jgi:hypothetical protein